ncbi:hypothetical protein J1N35_014413 [Gossypium stocksii]|uniref:Uncharacterized protein n=1 Tax=Gossypium stocksii TaxID=47602 RepID=A0A9D4A9W8_9ROSI|nr:hypothetical protein J1N35_014413 [Gossypium stocksii]
MNFVVVPTTLAVIPAALEFYSNLRFSKKNKVYDRHKKINISSKAISDYYGVHHYESDNLSTMDLNNLKNVDMNAVLAFFNLEERECTWVNNYLLSFKQAIKMGFNSESMFFKQLWLLVREGCLSLDFKL